MYGNDLTVGSWIALRGPCSVRHSVNDRDSVEFSFRSGSVTFDMAFDAEALETFLRHGTDALREMEDRRVSPRRVNPPASLRSHRWANP